VASPRPARAGGVSIPLWTDAAVDRALALVLAAATLAIDLFKLPGTSLWSDEAFSVGLVRNPWPVFWDYVRTLEPNMVLYHLLLRGWLGLTGIVGLVPDEVIMRAPSVAFGVIGAVVVFTLGLRFFGRTAGAIGAVLFSLNRLELEAAREARSYSLEVLLICVGWYALFAALTAERRRSWWWFGYGLAMTLALYAHLFSALVLAAQLVAFALLLFTPNDWQNQARLSLREMAGSVAVICAAISPMVVYAVGHGSTNPWIQPAGASDIARLLWNIAGHNIMYGLLLGAAVVTAAVSMIHAARGLPVRGLEPGRSLALACWLLVPVILSYIATQPRFNLHLFAWGYLVVIVPALCLLAGIGLAAVPWQLARRAAVVCLIATAALATPVYSSSLPTQDFRAAARWMADRYQAGDGLVSALWSSSLAMDYYAGIGAIPSALVACAPSAWSWREGGERTLDQGAVAAYAATHGRVFLVSSLQEGDKAANVEQVRTTESQFAGRYVLVGAVVVPSQLGAIHVRLYETGGSTDTRTAVQERTC
jgi:mannosyltransferase